MSIRRPITRSDAKKMMVDALKASSKSTTENRSARTFKVSNFKLPESGVIDVSTEDIEKGYRKKRKRSQGPGTQGKIEEQVNKQETVDNLRKQSILAGRVLTWG